MEILIQQNIFGENVGGKSIDSELWMMDLKTGQLENLKVDGKQAKFLP
jgi:hypothetical protein